MELSLSRHNSVQYSTAIVLRCACTLVRVRWDPLFFHATAINVLLYLRKHGSFVQ